MSSPEEESKEEPIISKRLWAGCALGSLSGGMFYGFNRVMKEQKVHLTMRAHAAPTALAGKAFAAATLLCFGTLIGCTSVFVAVTGITSASQFGKATQDFFSKFVESPSLSVEATDDRKNTQGMDASEEMNYVQKRYFTGLYVDDTARAEEFDVEDVAEVEQKPKTESGVFLKSILNMFF